MRPSNDASSLKSELIVQVFQSILRAAYIAPWAWTVANINFRSCKDYTSIKFDAELTPYLRDPINAWDFCGVKREVTCVAPEQTGKTLSWLAGLLWSFIYRPCVSLVVYQSDDKAREINETKMRPLMAEIPDLATQLAMPRSVRSDCYSLSRVMSYFLGAGAPITSTSSRIRVADEVDKWQEHEGRIANIHELRKRARSFDDSMLFKICTPDGDADGSAIWQEFQQSSRGYWHLRCLGCGGLTMRSCDVHNLQWELTSDDKIVSDSLRLVCPVCKREHVEADSPRMNMSGGYVHEDAELVKTHSGFQWGALASQVPDLGWLNIARAQMRAGRSGDYKDQLLFDNSIRGLPYVRRRSQDSEENILRKHCADLPPREAIKYALMSADTQNDGWYYVVRGFDDSGNSYLLNHGKAREIEDLLCVVDGAHHGKRVSLCIVDQGGHRAREIQRLSHTHRRVITYKGSTGTDYASRRKAGVVVPNYCRISDGDERCVMAHPKLYQAKLLYMIYQRCSVGERGWFLPNDISAEYIDQLLDVKPNKRMRAGHDYRNWDSSGNDHYFDAEKMLLVCSDVYRPRAKATPIAVRKPKYTEV